ncbi:MAG TPA: hypothetical protein VEB40_13145 [Flavipsychrobacter sp.]|nr:hypothetical protein [Flavipsychrobacter sp.]
MEGESKKSFPENWFCGKVFLLSELGFLGLVEFLKLLLVCVWRKFADARWPGCKLGVTSSEPGFGGIKGLTGLLSELEFLELVGFLKLHVGRAANLG